MSNVLLYIRTTYLVLLVLLTSLFQEGLNLGATYFLLPSILMGLGVAIDVCIATIVKFKDDNLSWKTWTLPVTATHTLFPAIGYFLFWNLSTALPFAQQALGIIGFVLVGLFVYEVVCEAAGITPLFGISKVISNLFGFDEEDARLFIAVLAVSWDALWSGPAKAAQATVGGWNEAQVILSFAIAGLVVALVAELALFISKRLRKMEFSNPLVLSRFNIIGKYIELSVIGGFGVLSLWHTFSTEASLYGAILISSAILCITFLLLRKKLIKNQLQEAKTVVES